MDSLPDFLALIEGRSDAEVEHALAVATAVAHHYDRFKEHAPMAKKNAQGIPQVDVKVKTRAGCELDGKTEEHTHPQQEWRKLIDSTRWDRNYPDGK